MLIRNRKAIDRAMRKHDRLRSPISKWMEIVEAAEWHDIIEARATWPTTDVIKDTVYTCFNVGGNSYRLIAIVSWDRQEIVIEEILTHAEYTKKWTK